MDPDTRLLKSSFKDNFTDNSIRKNEILRTIASTEGQRRYTDDRQASLTHQRAVNKGKRTLTEGRPGVVETATLLKLM